MANYVSDYNIFIANWLKNLNLYEKKVPNKVIMNGADSKLFDKKNYTPWNLKDTLKIVTHHWGGNYMKGFDVYEKIDLLVKSNNLKNKIKFTYIGNLPKNLNFQILLI